MDDDVDGCWALPYFFSNGGGGVVYSFHLLMFRLLVQSWNLRSCSLSSVGSFGSFWNLISDYKLWSSSAFLDLPFEISWCFLSIAPYSPFDSVQVRGGVTRCNRIIMNIAHFAFFGLLSKSSIPCFFAMGRYFFNSSVVLNAVSVIPWFCHLIMNLFRWLPSHLSFAIHFGQP